MLNCLCGREMENLMATIGVGFLTQEFDIQTESENCWQPTLYLWDTSGTERYRSIITPYLRHVGIVIIAFDVGDTTTWQHVDYWRNLALEQAETVFDGGESLPLFCLVGCQADKPPETHVVSEKEIAEKAAAWNCPWWKVSTRAALNLQGTPPHLIVGNEQDEKITLVENPQSASVWSHFLKLSPRLLSPKEQMFTVFSHMAVEFHRFAQRVGHEKLNYETTSLGPAPPAVFADGGNVVRIERTGRSRRRKSDCCLDK